MSTGSRPSERAVSTVEMLIGGVIIVLVVFAFLQLFDGTSNTQRTAQGKARQVQLAEA